jgi:hypothetical protein
MRRNRELADVRAAYDYEKLTGEQYRLTLERIRLQTMWMIVSAVCLCTGGGALLFYRRRQIRKERAMRGAKKRLQELTEQIALNQLTIRSNEEIIQTIGEQLRRQTDLEEYVREQQADIERISETNERLLQQNRQLENGINDFSSLLQDTGTGQPELDGLPEENRLLQEKEKYFREQLGRQLPTIGSLKKNPLPVTPEERKRLMDEMEIIYPGFVAHLRKTFPGLSDLDLQTCCLIKLKFPVSRIAIITNVNVNSISKRKYRIRETMREAIPDIWDGGESLDFYIYKLTPHKEK